MPQKSPFTITLHEEERAALDVRIPRQADHLFQAKATTRSGAKRPSIPTEADQ